MKKSISFAITVHDEHIELDRLLSGLVNNIWDCDEIVVQGDFGNVTDLVVNVLNKYKSKFDITYIEYPLNKDYSTFKNNLFKYCTKDYIFQIDADEYFLDFMNYINNLHKIIEIYDIDVYAVPRKNVVIGMTQEHINIYNWDVQEIFGESIINYPDYQTRFFKNDGILKFYGNVHEKIDGWSSMGHFPTYTDDDEVDYTYSLIHIKDIERQVAMNKFYSTIAR